MFVFMYLYTSLQSVIPLSYNVNGNLFDVFLPGWFLVDNNQTKLNSMFNAARDVKNQNYYYYVTQIFSQFFYSTEFWLNFDCIFPYISSIACELILYIPQYRLMHDFIFLHNLSPIFLYHSFLLFVYPFLYFLKFINLTQQLKSLIVIL